MKNAKKMEEIAKGDSVKMKQLKECLKGSTIHGLTNIIESTSWHGRIFWLMIFLCNVFIAIFGVIDLIKGYSLGNTLLVHKNYPANELDFPAVTLCNTNNIQTSKVEKYQDVDHVSQHFLNKSLQHGNLLPPVLFSSEWMKHTANLTLMRETRSNSKMLFPSGLNGWCVFETFTNCSKDDFSEAFPSSTTGFCQTFNKNGTYRQTRPGPHSGLFMKMYINQEDYASLLPNDMGAGVHLFIHPKDVLPDNHETGVLLAPGTMTILKIGLKTYQRLLNCTNQRDNTIIPGRYTEASCHTICINTELKKACGRVDTTITYHLQKEEKMQQNANSKNNSEFHKCKVNTYKKIVSGEIKCKCQIPCFEEKYALKATSSKWPSQNDIPYYKKVLGKVLNKTEIIDEFVYNNMAAVYIFFESLNSELIEEQLIITGCGLFGGIGGILGLCIGASAYSIAELFTFLLKSLFADRNLKAVAVEVRNEKGASENGK